MGTRRLDAAVRNTVVRDRGGLPLHADEPSRQRVGLEYVLVRRGLPAGRGARGGADGQYPIYVGFDEDGQPLEHDANQLQYAHHVTNTTLNRFDRQDRESEPEVTEHAQ